MKKFLLTGCCTLLFSMTYPNFKQVSMCAKRHGTELIREFFRQNKDEKIIVFGKLWESFEKNKLDQHYSVSDWHGLLCSGCQCPLRGVVNDLCKTYSNRELGIYESAELVDEVNHSFSIWYNSVVRPREGDRNE